MRPLHSRSLFLRIYLGCIVAYLAIGGAVVLFLQDGLSGRELRFLPLLVTRDLAARRADPRSLAEEQAWLRKYPFPISVYDDKGSLIASTVEPPLPAVPPALVERLRTTGKVSFDADHVAFAEIAERGRPLAIGVLRERKSLARKIVERMLAWFVGYLIFAALFARSLVKPLQHLVSTAQRFGTGDLGARAGLHRSDEIGAVGRAFDEMADRVNALIAAQQELMANVSHELQTPLARIHVALEHIAVKGTEKAAELLPEIEMDLSELQRLFDDVMMVARFDLSKSHAQAVQTPLRIEVVSVDLLLQKVAARFRGEHPSHPLIVDVQPGLPDVRADRVLLRRAIENLTENARKYSEPGSTVRINATARIGILTIEVTDTGIGIDAADLKQVFTPFFRSDRSRARQTGGVGLGLALVRRVVEAHGGTVQLTSAPARGTTAVITLPTEPRR